MNLDLVAHRTAEAARRRVEGRQRTAALVQAEINHVEARLAGLAAATAAAAARVRRCVATGLDCVRRATAGELQDAQQRAAAVNRAAAHALHAALAEHRALAALRDQLAAEMAEAHP